MRLALGLGDVDQVGFAEPARLLQHRPGDRDVVVLGEPAHHLDRRIADRGEAIGELGARFRLDLGNQAAEHVVEQPDMVLVEPARPAQEECRDALERVGAPLGRAGLDDVFELRDRRRGSGHDSSPRIRRGGIGKAAVGMQARSGF
jgi:hypothetical protein